MLNSKSFRTAFAPALMALALLSGALFSSSPAKAAGSDPAAEAFVTHLSDQVLAALSNKSLSKPQLENTFATLLDQNADMTKIAGFCLGQFMATPTQEQKAEYLTLFRKFVAKIYATRLADYSDQKLAVTGSQATKDTRIIVNSEVSQPEGQQPVKVTWWLIKENGGYKVFDVNVVGVWLAQEQRSSFTSVINNAGGKFDALLTHLKNQIAEADAGKLLPVAGQQ